MDISEPYDINFCFPVPASLENDRVRLTPFIPSLHGQVVYDQLLLAPHLFDHPLLFGPYKDIDDFLTNLVENRFRQNPQLLLLVIFDKTGHSQLSNYDCSAGALAGLMGFRVNKDTVPNRAPEVELHVIILPPFQRTHVMSNAVGLSLNFLLNTPTPSYPNALGLRRVVWHTSTANEASIRDAERMGFTVECVMRWQSVLPLGIPGSGVLPREGDPMKENLGRDTVALSLCWDEWEGGVRDKVTQIMNRVA
ncbi:hypothetical protein JR316_0012432 [Psilocybe cubensis]|uniref:Uncharacterized protein n=1 Tax=Psilocybe cubensis TaxID=181762 RepID=A0ACB8GII3_PSICU|nr:hypothetical protein JR316_0012432 [Psilocybe cubensis]KAH9475321.1 hypothetical protein JR316_0012432 [Psilocybe cubensis]